MLHKYCPTDDETCPYYDPKNGECELEDPSSDCDDYMYKIIENLPIDKTLPLNDVIKLFNNYLEMEKSEE